MTFEEDLTKRRIDTAAFAAGDPARYAQWKEMYTQMHPNSFYVSVKMVLNDVRRKFWLAEAAKPVVIATEAPVKPVTRRASIPGAGATKPEIKPPIAGSTPESEPTEQPKPAAPPGKGRAVIRKAAPVNSELPEATESTALPTDKPTSEEAPKVPRARPVIRKPTPVADNTDAPNTNQEQIAQDGTNSAVPFHTNPNPEAATSPKPPRPRPVFRKTGAASPEELPAAEIPAQMPVAEETVAPLTAPIKAEEAKPPRPRPVFKKPAENINASEPKPDTENPTQALTPPTESSTTAAAAKPPRPRPVIRRPNIASEPSQLVEPTESTPQDNNAQAETPPPVTEPPKPPRPRPIFKRPNKPDDLKE